MTDSSPLFPAPGVIAALIECVISFGLSPLANPVSMIVESLSVSGSECSASHCACHFPCSISLLICMLANCFASLAVLIIDQSVGDGICVPSGFTTEVVHCLP